MQQYGIDNLSKIMDEVKADVKVTEYTMDEKGNETVSESGIYMIISMLLGIIIWMFIMMFGGQVMSSVIEEKTSRVVEVLISSVKAIDLMFGKIIGVALVALTQFFLWIVLTGVLVTVATSVVGKDMLTGMAGNRDDGPDYGCLSGSDAGSWRDNRHPGSGRRLDRSRGRRA